MILDKASLQAVIERLEKADGPDREIDVDIAIAVGLKYGADPVDWGLFTPHWYDGSGWVGSLPHYTASVDAAIALTERMLPGWARVFKYLAGESAYVFLIEYERGEDGLWWHNTGEHLKIKASHKTEPLALLLALFKVLLVKG